MDDRYGLRRLEIAQSDTYELAASELPAGRKTGHWIWFIFPQLVGLGCSPMSNTYAIASLEEAIAYLAHPVLGPRLVECAGILTRLRGRTAIEIFGCTDAQKLRSSMTLFASAAPENPVFRDVLAEYFDGSGDPCSEEILLAQARPENA